MIDQSLLSGIASHFNRLAKQIEKLTFESEMKASIPFSAIHKNCLEEHMKELQAWVKKLSNPHFLHLSDIDRRQHLLQAIL
jgi:hypothetical protein